MGELSEAEKKRLYMIPYDGFNIFHLGKWTGIAFNDRDEAMRWVRFLRPLTDEQIKEWVKTWN